MHRSYVSAVSLHRPQLVLFLGQSGEGVRAGGSGPSRGEWWVLKGMRRMAGAVKMDDPDSWLNSHREEFL